MKTKVILLPIVLSATLLASASAWARGPGGTNRGNTSGPRGSASAACDLSGSGQGTPLRDGSGKSVNNRGNPDASGTRLKDGSGKATAPGKGAKDGTGNKANCPTPAPKT